jgi:hypothetical protein
MRPGIERYVRSVVQLIPGIEVSAGLEYRPETDRFLLLRLALQDAIQTAYRKEYNLLTIDHMIAGVEKEVSQRWPDRAFFVELGDPNGDSYTQIFQPYPIDV